MEETERNDGISFSEIVRTIGKRIYMILALTALATLLLTLAVCFLYNPHTSEYSLTFAVFYPGSDSMKYPDGSPFEYRTIASESVLSEAKSTDGAFSSVDVAKMVAADDVYVTAETAESGGTVKYTGWYTISVKTGYFKNKAIATSFLRRTASVFVDRVNASVGELDFLLDESVFAQADFDDRIELLAEQRKSLLSLYDEWIDLYRDSYVIHGKDGEQATLKNYRARVEVLFNDGVKQSLQEELERCGYVPVEFIEEKVAELQAEKVEVEKKIASLQSALGGVSLAAEVSGESDASEPVLDVSQTLAKLLSRRVELETIIGALNAENVTAFENRLQGYYESLRSAATTVHSVAVALYGQETHASFETKNAVKSGGIHPALAAIGGFILMFLVIGGVYCAVAIPKQRRKANPPAPVPEKQPEPVQQELFAPVPEEQPAETPEEVPSDLAPQEEAQEEAGLSGEVWEEAEPPKEAREQPLSAEELLARLSELIRKGQ